MSFYKHNLDTIRTNVINLPKNEFSKKFMHFMEEEKAVKEKYIERLHKEKQPEPEKSKLKDEKTSWLVD